MGSIVDVNDFENNALADNGVVVTRTPVTTDFLSNGEEIIVDGTPEDITVVLHINKPNYSQNTQGLLEAVSGYVMVSPTQEINRDDKITYNNVTYRVLNVIERGVSGDIVFYKYCDIGNIS